MEGVKRVSIPRFGSILPPEKGIVRRGPLPTGMFERLESFTAVDPIHTTETGTAVNMRAFIDDQMKKREDARMARIEEYKKHKDKDVIDFDFRPTAPKKITKVPVPAVGKIDAVTDISNVPKPLADLTQRILGTDVSRVEIHPVNKILKQSDVFVPSNRKYFKEFIFQSYYRYKLKDVPAIPDPDACAKAAEASKKEVKTFAYQSFVRDYIQRPSPYRGVLVYHGLGSGKTCTSIAALEALYQQHQRPIYVFTPASLQPNYRDEITKCGPYIFRLQNHWIWVPVSNLREITPQAKILLDVIRIPRSSIKKRGGGWLPDPAKSSNFDALSIEQRKQVMEQIMEMMDARFQFINYNGVNVNTVRSWACSKSNPFDGATIIIDEVHNLIRTINNSDLAGFYKDEPRSMATYDPVYCEVATKKYNRSYLLYRLMCDAVGAKIIALSATPIINFPQEIAILANLLAGNTRIVEITTPVFSNDIQRKIEQVCKFHPEIDFFEIKPLVNDNTMSSIRITPVPSGYYKVVNPDSGELRGFVRDARGGLEDVEIKRERNLREWFERIQSEINKVTDIRHTSPFFRSVQRLPDTEDEFKQIFIDTENLKVNDSMRLLLMARLSGLVSYYKGGKKDLMASSKEYIVEVTMSDQQLKEYTSVRNEEIKREQRAKPSGAKQKKESLFQLAMRSMNSTFKIFSRAACNFSFPSDMDRPRPSDYREAGIQMIGALPGISGDAVGDESDRTLLDPEGLLYDSTAPVKVTAIEDDVGAAAAPKGNENLSYEKALYTAIRTLRERAPELFVEGKLKDISPKFQAVLDRLKTATGPVLVYSNFKTLEGVGLFGIALETQQNFRKLDIQQIPGGDWTLTAESLAPTSAESLQYYISYTGDEDRYKRNILLAIFNGKWSKVPGKLAKQVQEVTGATNNYQGKICKVFMITQSGAEGISLSNVRQVHIMEPYWNYVRLDQVKGRAVRICSHMDLLPDDRHVDTYIYLAKFSDEQKKEKKIDETLLNFDEGLTTDEAIWKLMNAKKKLADSILDVMKQAAVDCELNTTENGGYACYRLKGASMDHLFHPFIEVDIAEGAAAYRAL